MSPPAAPFRLPSGGLVDRNQQLHFSFDGRPMTGLAGDTLASALLANGVRLVGRSFKYHRPRGVLTAGAEEPNALVELRSGDRREPNTRATTIELYDGLDANSQNRWPTLRHDLMAVSQVFSKLMVAGFYYKTFKWPSQFWELIYEPLIRRAAGLGRAAEAPDPDLYETATAHCDVLVVGSGPAGLAAALAAGRSGARVILAETDHAFGGRLLSEQALIDGHAASAWISATLSELRSLPDVTLMPRTCVFGAYDGGTYGALERVNDHVAVPPAHQPRQRLWRIIVRRTVVAAGAIERPIVFPGNDRPGVMLASAVRTYLTRYGVTPGRRVGVFTCTDDGWRTVETLVQAGVRVAAVVDSREQIAPRHTQLARSNDITVHAGHVVSTEGSVDGLRSFAVVRHGGGSQVVDADCLAVAGGWNPNGGLTCHFGGRPVWQQDVAAFVPGGTPPGMIVAGAAQGALSLGSALSSGFSAGLTAAEAVGKRGSTTPAPSADDEPTAITPVWHVSGSGKAFVDLQNDVTVDDIALAHREGYASVEHLKRYTTLGMATDQGKTANVNGLAILAAVAGQSIADTGTTTWRPPVEPVAIGALAGHTRGYALKPTRLPPSHAWAREQGASFVESGLWLRAEWYPRSGEPDWLTSVNREVMAVRTGVGVCDVSTLGKIEVHGPDAGAFLDFVYTGTMSTLAVGRVRYGVMLREDGFVMDDGTVARLGVEHFVVTTTTANAGKVMQHLEFARQVTRPDLDVGLVSVSEQWAQFSVSGPRALEVVERVLDPEHARGFPKSLPPQSVLEATVGNGIPARLFRISYSGERALEISVPAQYGNALIRRLMDVGAPFAMTPYGVEALNVLRIEKGHVAGNEINGTTTAADLGLGALVSTRKDFIGRTLAGRPGLTTADRWNIVGFRPIDPTRRLTAGAHVVPVGVRPTAKDDQGYMTSVAFSPVLGTSIGLGLINRGRKRWGERVRAYDPLRGSDIDVEICNPVFYDPEGGRQRD